MLEIIESRESFKLSKLSLIPTIFPYIFLILKGNVDSNIKIYKVLNTSSSNKKEK